MQNVSAGSEAGSARPAATQLPAASFDLDHGPVGFRWRLVATPAGASPVLGAPDEAQCPVSGLSVPADFVFTVELWEPTHAVTGRLDIVIGGRWYETPADLRKGRWQEHVFTDWFPPAVVRVADVNGDGQPNVILTHSEGKGRLSWFQAPEDPRARWTEHVVDDSLDYAHSLVVCDLSGDGTLDIVTAEMHQSERRRVLVYLNDGRGMTWRREVVSTQGSHGLCVADLGALGKALVGANWSGGYQPVEMWRADP